MRPVAATVRSWLSCLVPAVWRSSGILRSRVEHAAQGRVLSGPFEGMRFLSRAWGTYYPKLLGTYELELHPWLHQVLTSEIDHAIVVGAAEGYYAVGFAWRRPDWTVCAFEAHPKALEALAELACLNSVEDRINFLGLCDIPALAAALERSSTPLVFMDVEGTESVLLDPRVVPGLARAYIIVELHKDAVPGIEATLRDRFGGTQAIASAAQKQRKATDFPMPLEGLRASYLEGAAIQLMSEFRSEGQSWLIVSPRTQAPGSMPSATKSADKQSERG